MITIPHPGATVRRSAAVLFTAAIALGALAAEGEETATVDTTHPCYDADTGELSFPEERVYFHEGESKIGNTAASPHPWDTTEPASVQTGAGAGQLTLSSQAGGGETNTVFEGTFTGCIDTLLFDLYSFDPTNRSSTAADGEPNDHTLSITVSIDGLPVYANGTAQTLTTYAEGAMGPNLNRIALDLGDTLESFQAYGYTLDGDHTITVEIAPYYINTGAAVVYAWDTSETPSGITFNGAITDDHPPAN